jgi:hypothetical protein
MKDWFQTPLGQWLLTTEQERCQHLVPAGYYPTALQLGMGQRDFLHGIEVGARFVADTHNEPVMKTPGDEMPVGSSLHHVQALPWALPFSDKTHSLIVMPHILDFCEDPHAVLREVNQILIPEGCVVITGFNQVSLWGAVRMTGTRHDNSPWAGNYYRVGRVQDWLSLLGFDIVGASMFAYQPPLQNEKWRNKLSIFDKIGERWWPGFGAIYMIVGKKREIASSTGGSRLAWRQFIPAIARPAVSSAGGLSASGHHAARGRLHLVAKN